MSKMNFWLIAILSLGILISSCNKEDQPTSTDPALLSFINDCIDCPSLRLYVGDSIKGSVQIFYSNAQSHVPIPYGNQNIKIKDNANTTTFIDHVKNFEASKAYTLLIQGTKSAPAYAYINDDFTIKDSTKANVRIINLLSDGTNIDLNNGGTNNLISNIVANGYSGFIQTVDGFQNFDIKVAGTNQILSSAKFTLYKSKFYTIYYYGTKQTLKYGIIVR